MLRKQSGGVRYETRELLQRLSALDNEDVPTDIIAERGQEHLAAQRRRILRRYFGLGFESSCIAGGVALLILLLMNPGPARGNSLIDGARTELLFWFGPPIGPRRGGGVPTSAQADIVWPELALEGRKLWWKLPLSNAS